MERKKDIELGAVSGLLKALFTQAVLLEKLVVFYLINWLAVSEVTI